MVRYEVFVLGSRSPVAGRRSSGDYFYLFSPHPTPHTPHPTPHSPTSHFPNPWLITDDYSLITDARA
ncbi:MAG: hypothetical protein DWQ51_17010 [Microcystis wesenbergii TW10]|uniref:Uncharacterized protein n=2 Tax=Microcystis TaxID=1125 RepID=A0A552AIK2_MICAE|nr:MAG: hypothetical protein DWQ51_17010 [Microcystis wesenbergii TW10]TRT85297.1 MAG: hypothetical protein EWV63_13555 [Microcystis aeruginosa Ma_OC_H_19870700_S124]